MTDAEKIDFIFKTGRRAHLHIEEQVMPSGKIGESQLEDLSTVQLKVALQIHQDAPMSLSELADSLGLSHSSASVIVDKLVEKRIVSRETDPGDRRRIRLQIHSRAKKQMEDLQIRFQEAFAQIASKVGHLHLEQWYQVAVKINEILSDNGGKNDE